jgi:hypothetical protein
MTRSRVALCAEISPEEPNAFVLVAHGPPVVASEVEAEDSDALEVRVFWERAPLATHHLGSQGTLVIGDHEDSIAQIPESALGAPVVELARATRTGFMVRVPPRAVARLGSGSRVIEIEGPREYETSLGDALTMTIGRFRLEIAHGRAGRGIPARTLLERIEDSATLQVAGAALVHAALLGVVAFQVPGLAVEEPGGMERSDQVGLMRQYLRAAAERERDRADAPASELGGSSASDPGGGAPAAGDEGKMGKSGAPVADKRWGKLGPKDNRDAALGREGAALPKGFELIGLIAENQGDPNAPSAPWGRLDALGSDPVSALGNMWGRTIGEAAGLAGLGLTGTGEGGGGHQAQWVGLDMTDFGRMGRGFGPPGDGDGMGRGRSCNGCRLQGHAVTSPSIRPGVTTVAGHIPADVIQRVVRDNFGRFRGCYEGGLRENPSLEGRVITRFVIDRQGMVTSAQDGGSSLPNSSVVACVVRSFYSLTFPEHEGGIVTVVYPLALRPE